MNALSALLWRTFSQLGITHSWPAVLFATKRVVIHCPPSGARSLPHLSLRCRESDKCPICAVLHVPTQNNENEKGNYVVYEKLYKQ